MKAARRLRPRNPVALQPLLRKGGAHAPAGKHAQRARQKAETRRRLRDDTSGE
ncbi:MAG TPA: hypothetical protein PLE72_08120 [Azospira sp.]|nr:hypothetical protein [Azospira sp.]